MFYKPFTFLLSHYCPTIPIFFLIKNTKKIRRHPLQSAAFLLFAYAVKFLSYAFCVSFSVCIVLLFVCLFHSHKNFVCCFVLLQINKSKPVCVRVCGLYFQSFLCTYGFVNISVEFLSPIFYNIIVSRWFGVLDVVAGGADGLVDLIKFRHIGI